MNNKPVNEAFGDKDNESSLTSASQELVRAYAAPATTTNAAVDSLIYGAIALHHKKQRQRIAAFAIFAVLLIAVVAMLLVRSRTDAALPALPETNSSIAPTSIPPTIAVPIASDAPSNAPTTPTETQANSLPTPSSTTTPWSSGTAGVFSEYPISVSQFSGDPNAEEFGGINAVLGGLRANKVVVSWKPCTADPACPMVFELTVTNTSQQAYRESVGVGVYVDGGMRYGKGSTVSIQPGQTVTIPFDFTSMYEGNTGGIWPTSTFAWNWYIFGVIKD